MSWPKEGSREIHDGIIVSLVPDICLTPGGGGMVPVPYTIWCRQADAANLANSVRLTDDRSHAVASLVLHCYGDEPGTGGGVKSGTTGAECTPKTWSQTVRAENRNMVRHLDEWWMNHRNTYGQLLYTKNMALYGDVEPEQISPRMRSFRAATAGNAAPAPLMSQLAQGSAVPVGPGEGVGGLGGATTGLWVYERARGVAKGLVRGLEKATEGIRSSNKERECDCLTGAYDNIVGKCKEECGASANAHHIVADYTLRYGTRAEGMAGLKRIPGLPDFWSGPAICLVGRKSDVGSEHSIAHESTDPEIFSAGSQSAIPGTADIHTITQLSYLGASEATGGACDEQIREALAAQPSLDSSILGRTTQSLPIPNTPSYDALQEGLTATKH